MRKILFFLIAGLVFFASCKIKTHIHFNKDNSGTVTLEYDFTQFINESGGQDSTGFIDSMTESLKHLDTIGLMNKYFVSKLGNGIKVTYAFDNIDDLNKSLKKFADGDEEMEHSFGAFSAKRNKISYKVHAVKKEDETESSISLDGLIELEMVVSFEKTIKKFPNKNYEMNGARNEIKISGAFSKFSDPEIMDFTVKLK